MPTTSSRPRGRLFTPGNTAWLSRKTARARAHLAPVIADLARSGLRPRAIARLHPSIPLHAIRDIVQGNTYARFTGGKSTRATNHQKLTHARVASIKRALASPDPSPAHIARLHACRPNNVHSIQRLESWSHVLPALNPLITNNLEKSRAQWHANRRKIRGIAPDAQRRAKRAQSRRKLKLRKGLPIKPYRLPELRDRPGSAIPTQAASRCW